jgi:hypothetical protein
MEVLFRRADDTYVILFNGHPYQVLPDDPLYPEAVIAGASAPLDPIESFVPAPTLGERRASAKIDRGPLCLALFDQGILSGPSALAAAKGNWPSEFDGLLTGLAPAEQLAAQIAWADATVVQYQSALLQEAALSYAATPEAATALLDQLFGIGAE